ncbi:MAG: hypothetical protein M0R68_12505, partial [Bacteroidetes bacterium]|nr:hypothetical protein [Bacteroidota bacterium]
SKPTITFESTFGIVIPRYAARLGSYEFVADFSLIVLAFSLINISRNQYRLLSWISIAASMIIGIMSGTRSLFIILAIFIVMLIFYQRKKLGSVLKYGVVGVIFIIIAMPFIISYFQNSPLFARILDTIYKYQTQGLVGASNRNFEAGFMSLINFGSIFGLGSYYLNTLGPSEIVSHNVLFAMYGKYGVYGLAFMLGLFYKAYSTSKKVLKFSPDESARNESAFFLALLFALFAQEMKYSFIRDMSSILVYALMFMTLFVFTRSEHRLEKGNPA